MNLTYNKISKIFIITLFFSLFFLFPTPYINSSPKNLLVEDLLDELQKAETIIEAEIIRKKSGINGFIKCLKIYKKI